MDSTKQTILLAELKTNISTAHINFEKKYGMSVGEIKARRWYREIHLNEAILKSRPETDIKYFYGLIGIGMGSLSIFNIIQNVTQFGLSWLTQSILDFYVLIRTETITRLFHYMNLDLNLIIEDVFIVWMVFAAICIRIINTSKSLFQREMAERIHSKMRFEHEWESVPDSVDTNEIFSLRPLERSYFSSPIEYIEKHEFGKIETIIFQDKLLSSSFIISVMSVLFMPIIILRFAYSKKIQWKWRKKLMGIHFERINIKKLVVQKIGVYRRILLRNILAITICIFILILASIGLPPLER